MNLLALDEVLAVGEDSEGDEGGGQDERLGAEREVRGGGTIECDGDGDERGRGGGVGLAADDDVVVCGGGERLGDGPGDGVDGLVVGAHNRDGSDGLSVLNEGSGEKSTGEAAFLARERELYESGRVGGDWHRNLLYEHRVGDIASNNDVYAEWLVVLSGKNDFASSKSDCEELERSLSGNCVGVNDPLSFEASTRVCDDGVARRDVRLAGGRILV